MLKQPHHSLNLVLYRHSKPVAKCSTHYLGLLGLFIHTNQVRYPNFTHLEVGVVEPGSLGKQSDRFPVVVTANSNKGMGLTLINKNQDMADRWKRVITKAPK